MLVYLILSVTLLLSGLSLAGIARSARWQSLLAALSVAVFIYLYGAWVYLSIYIRYVHGAIALLLLVFTLWRWRKRPEPVRHRPGVGHLILALVFATLSVLYFTGTTGTPKTVALDFPLHQGRYFVLQGGKGLPANFFHYSYRGAVYAMDISRLDKYGRRAKHIFSPKLEDYYIFADTIFSPCDGVIQQATNDNPDNIPPSRKRGPSNTNSVLIETDTMYVFMAHLKHGGVFVYEGQRVKRGQPIGLVGNSGFTLEPHLHIQVHRKTGKEAWYLEEQLYIQFDGKTYLLFEIIPPRSTVNDGRISE